MAAPEPCSVDVWLVDAAEGFHEREAARVLSPEEQERAARFRSEHDRRCFVAGHFALRMLLAGYVDARPDELRFAVNEYGKPSLAAGEHGLHFSLSHTGSLALIAVGQCPLGVDLELCKPLADLDDLGKRCLSPDEMAGWARLDPGQRHQMFYQIWTCKEALLKGLGVGLSRDLDTLSVLSPHGELVEHVMVETRAGGQLWQVRLLQIPSSLYTAALAVPAEGGPVAIRQLRYALEQGSYP